jgi:hypothetical protein
VEVMKLLHLRGWLLTSWSILRINRFAINRSD